MRPIGKLGKVMTCLALLAATACVHIFRKDVSVEVLTAPAAPQRVTTPVKAHLLDQSLVYFPDGVVATADSLVGIGMWFGPTMAPLGRRVGVPLDSVVGFEALHGAGVNGLSSFVVSTLATGAFAASVPLLLIAIFGSCPTFYTSHADGFQLEAEGFSYSISPLLEARDVDVLRGVDSRDGEIVLEVRNEALETHFINHLELLQVELEPGEDVLPDPIGRPIAFRPTSAVLPGLDRAGRDVTGVLSLSDGDAFASSPSVVRKAIAGDPFEHLMVELPPMPGVQEAAVVMRVRNSLLTTMLLYDFMLAPAGLEAVDWITQGTGGIGSALELGRWGQQFMGLRVEVDDGLGGFTEVARIGDVGPIAWEEIVVPVPVESEGPTHVRISFLADAWRIDRIGLASEPRTPVVSPIAVSEVRGSEGLLDLAAITALGGADDHYLETRPGQRFTVEFQRADSGNMHSALLLASQGYYTEWVRQDWVRKARQPKAFEPSRAAIADLLERWTREKDSLEQRFFSTNLPVR